MNRKRDDFDSGNDLDHPVIPLPKRIKSPLTTMDDSKQNNRNGEAIRVHQKSSSHLNRDLVHDEHPTQSKNLSNTSAAQPSAGSNSTRKKRSTISQDDSGSNSTMETSLMPPKSNTNGQVKKKSDLSCVVCCGLAHGYNFDAISCESCKAFFRRNALYNTDRLKCRRDGSCEITLETRRRCKSCRLKKCFAVGMRKEWILTEEEKMNKKRRIEENRKLRLATLGDSSSSNEPTTETNTNNVNIDLELKDAVLEKTDVIISTSSSSVRTQDIIGNVVTAFKDGFQLEPISYGWSYPLARKVTALCQILNVKNITALRLISFYKRLYHFDELNEMDKVNLVKHNLPYVFFFHSSLGYDPVNDIYYEGNSTQDTNFCGSDIREIHGDGIYLRCTSIMRSLHSIVQLDKRIIKLALIIMLFSKGLSNTVHIKDNSLRNHKQVFNAQNFYVEHLWSFMENSFGVMGSVRTFTALISKCLLVQGLLRDIEQDIHGKFDPCQVPPIIRTLLDFSS